MGSEFNNAILKGFRTENDGVCNESYFRWLYSGICTSTGTFYIAQPQYIHPFMNCKISEMDSDFSISKQLLIFDSYTIPQSLAETVKLNNTNVAATICELTKAIDVNGYQLEEVKTCGEYLTKAIFSIPKEDRKTLIIDIHNKGAKDSFGVSSITIERNDMIDSSVIKQAIDSVMSKRPNDVCPNYINEIMDSFKITMLEHDISLEFITAKDYQVVYEASSCKGKAKLRFWYGTSLDNHNKGFINKIEAFDISDSNIITEIRNIIMLQPEKKL